MKTPLFIITLLSAILSACSTGRQYEAPTLQSANRQPAPIHHSERFQASEPIAHWWRQFEDEQLTQLVEKALEHNHDIRIAFANLQAARAFLDETYFDRLPTVRANGSAMREQLSDAGPQAPLNNRTFDNYNAGFDASWELDLWDRVRQGILAAEAHADSELANLQGVYISIAAEVARTYIEMRGAQYRLQVALRNVANQERNYDLVQSLANNGQAEQLDSERAATQLELTRHTIPLIEADIHAAINRLGVLTGETPSRLHTTLKTHRSLPSIPTTLAVGRDAVTMIKRRPDIRLAERALAQATAEYNMNVAELYPKVTLLGSLGFSATSLADVGSGASSVFQLGPRVEWAAFDLGRVKARIRAADAVSNARLATWEQTMLQALEEVDTAMVNFSLKETSRLRLVNAATSSAQAARYARERYDNGVDDFLDVLDAERTLLNVENQLAISETELAVQVIAIYKSLGGGWEVMELAAE